VLHDFEPRVVFDLEPADAVTVTTLMDNVTDVLMPDQAPAYRPPRFAGGRRPAATMEGGDALEALVAEHGFSVLTKGRPLYTVMGGFHLGGPIFEPLIPRVLDDLGALMPSVIVPARCTGWRAQHAIGARFGEAFVPDTAGTHFQL